VPSQTPKARSSGLFCGHFFYLLEFPSVFRRYQGSSTMPSIADPKRQTLNLRIKPEVRDLIDRAAKVRCKNRTDFIVDSARMAAENALLDQTLIIAGMDAFEQFQTRLDMPPQANPKLRKTMKTPAPWDILDA
jgi:uncharacterized protein (DUF1778 family)